MKIILNLVLNKIIMEEYRAGQLPNSIFVQMFDHGMKQDYNENQLILLQEKTLFCLLDEKNQENFISMQFDAGTERRFKLSYIIARAQPLMKATYPTYQDEDLIESVLIYHADFAESTGSQYTYVWINRSHNLK
jgi:hypothetical protein